MAWTPQLTSLRSLGRSPLPLWAAATLTGQAVAGLRFDLAPAVAASLAIGAALALPAGKWRATVAIGLALLGHHQVEALMRPPADPAHVSVLAPGRARLRARVVESSEREDGRLRLLLDVEAARRDAEWRPSHGRVQLTVGASHRAWVPDTRLEADVSLKRPRNFGNPGEFDYEGYLARRAVYATGFLLTDEGIEVVALPRPGWIDAWRARLRAIVAGFDTPAREILGALILGDMGALPRKVREEFAAAGVSHVLSISGLHVALVAGCAYGALRWLLARSRWLLLRLPVPMIAAALSLVPVWLYAELAQAGVATWRALTMLSVVVTAVLCGRRRDMLVSVAAAAVVVSLLWPGAVLDVSFQLSFVSVLALALGMERYWRWWTAVRQARLLHLRGRRYRWLGWLAASQAVNLCALLGTAPLTALHFNQVPLVALVANPVVVPLLGTAAVALGLLGALAALWADGPARLCLALAAIACDVGARVTGFMASLPGAGVRVITPSAAEVALMYGGLASWVLLDGRARRLGFAAVALLATADFTQALYERFWRRDLRLTFLSVGQGDCTVIQFPGSEVMVVDGGGLHGLDTGERIVAPYLWRRKIARVDYVVLTHPQLDHYGGLTFVAGHFAPREFWHGGGASQAAGFAALREALRDSGARDVVVRAAATREIGGCHVTALWPPGDGRSRRANDSSVVLRIQCGGASVLLPGDLEGAGESELLAASPEVRSELLKVGHHGSRTSSTPAFLAAVRPAAAVLSAGYANRYGFPHAGVLQAMAAAGVEVFRTDLDGAVSARASRDGVFSIAAHRRRSAPSTVVDSP
jgi:competence protein ComEC